MKRPKIRFMGFKKVTPEVLAIREKQESETTNFLKNQKPKYKWKGKVGYRKYLKSRYWKERKGKYWNQHKRICFCCGGRAVLLHHITYSRLEKELDKDLIPLCKNCHEVIHKVILIDNPKLKKAHHTLKELQN